MFDFTFHSNGSPRLVPYTIHRIELASSLQMDEPIADAEGQVRPDYEQLFPAKLHYLLELLEREGQAHICSFQSHGRALKVHDQERFVKEILPK